MLLFWNIIGRIYFLKLWEDVIKIKYIELYIIYGYNVSLIYMGVCDIGKCGN